MTSMEKSIYLSMKTKIILIFLLLIMVLALKKIKKMKRTHIIPLKKKNGSGLGLSIVSKIIHEHNGKIFFKKPSNNEGAEVTILLPKINE